MASTASALMTAVRRLSSRCTASSMVLREVSGSHKLTVDGCKISKKLPTHESWRSKPFTVAGHSWRIRYYPHGGPYGDQSRDIGLYLELNPTTAIKEANCSVELKLSLLDQSGNPVPKFTRGYAVRAFKEWSGHTAGSHEFATWSDLEESGCLRGDRFAVRCDITVTTDVTQLGGAGADDDDEDAAADAPAGTAAVMPGSKAPREHLASTDHLWKLRHGADVTVDVGGEVTFDAHGWVLADRSPVFKAELELLAASNSTKPAAARRRIEVKGMEPKVFDAVLRYMYTNALPEMKQEDGDDDAMAMAQGLLAAADRFKIEKLKLTCEETLSGRIDVSTAAGILAVAEQHGCGVLKAACVEFLMSRPQNLKAVMETEGYEKAREIVQPLVADIAVKQWLALATATKCIN
ncbi:unnamed protein product [Urochloa decumbens]|uniref:Uncharacterized protein n=1 Tax=Urochloa decumbens TaxID=240449 RepID=A0ABC8VKW1_9POAL